MRIGVGIEPGAVRKNDAGLHFRYCGLECALERALEGVVEHQGSAGEEPKWTEG